LLALFRATLSWPPFSVSSAAAGCMAVSGPFQRPDSPFPLSLGFVRLTWVCSHRLASFNDGTLLGPRQDTFFFPLSEISVLANPPDLPRRPIERRAILIFFLVTPAFPRGWPSMASPVGRTILSFFPAWCVFCPPGFRSVSFVVRKYRSPLRKSFAFTMLAAVSLPRSFYRCDFFSSHLFLFSFLPQYPALVLMDEPCFFFFPLSPVFESSVLFLRVFPFQYCLVHGVIGQPFTVHHSCNSCGFASSSLFPLLPRTCSLGMFVKLLLAPLHPRR